MLRNIAVFVAFVYVAFFCSDSMLGGEAQSNKDLLFYVSFDKGADADFSVGSSIALIKGKYKLEKSIFNKALKINYPCEIRYEASKNINAHEGSILMWIKPILPSWTNGQPQFGIFSAGSFLKKCYKFSNGNLNENIFNPFLSLYLHYSRALIPFPVRVYEGPADAMLALMPGLEKEKKTLDLLKAQSAVLRGRWSHIALIWREKKEKNGNKTAKMECLLYRNGELIGKTLFSGKWPKNLGKYLFLGRGPHRAEGTFLIDELKIFNKAFSRKEIEKEYNKQG